MNYKVGDKVKVLSKKLLKNGSNQLLKNRQMTGVSIAVGAMTELTGKICTIRYVDERGQCYYIEESQFAWGEWMFEDKSRENIIEILRRNK